MLSHFLSSKEDEEAKKESYTRLDDDNDRNGKAQ